MGKIDLGAVKVRPMVRGDITPTLNIWWADIPKREMLASQLGGRFDLSLIAEHEGHLIGFVLARLIYAGLPMSGVAVIFFIAVKPDYQGQGIGSLLLGALKEKCKAAGIQTLRALVPQEDVRITRYFRRAGFQPSHIINLDCPI